MAMRYWNVRLKSTEEEQATLRFLAALDRREIGEVLMEAVRAYYAKSLGGAADYARLARQTNSPKAGSDDAAAK